MSRISIDVTAEQHQKLKALAALQGKSIKQYILESTLGGSTLGGRTHEALTELEAILDERLRNARASTGGSRTVGEVFRDAYRKGAADERNG